MGKTLNPLGGPFRELLFNKKNMVPANRPFPKSNEKLYKAKQGVVFELFDWNNFLRFSPFYQYYGELFEVNKK